MKKTTLAFLFILFCIWAKAGSKIIKDPYVEFQNSGIHHVTQVELTDTATLITVHNTFLPKWWISFDKTDYIQDCESGKKYSIKSVIAGTLGEKIWMPKSGDSTLVLAFEPFEESVKKIDYSPAVFGICLDNTTQPKAKGAENYDSAKKWMDAELAKAPKRAPLAFDSPDFFKADTAYLVGYIKGYDVRAGFSTGIIYIENVATHESYPIVAQIQPNGRLTAAVPMIHPQHLNLSINHSYISVYMEPGQTLGLVLDWNDFLDADRYRNKPFKAKRTMYYGALAQINQDICSFQTEQPDYKIFQKQVVELSPEDFKKKYIELRQKELNRFADFTKEHPLCDQAKQLLSNEINLDYVTKLFDFVMHRSYSARNDTSNQVLKMPVELTYYDFLKGMPLNDNSLLSSDNYGVFINRFEFMAPFTELIRRNKPSIVPEKTFYEYLIDEKVQLTSEDAELVKFITKKDKTTEEQNLMREKVPVINLLHEKYNENYNAYAEKYVKTLTQSIGLTKTMSDWRAKDSLLTSDLNLEPGLTYNICKIRSLGFNFDHMTKEDAETLWSFLKRDIPQTTLAENGDRLFEQKFPGTQVKSYALPAGHATDVFRKVIDPFKGKILFVDFWATTCGPCVAGIKRMKENRTKYKNNADFDFIFITDERSSPEAAYKNIVEEQELTNTYRLSTDDYNYLRQLFRFNGIPHYVLVDKDGRILNDQFEMYNFERELPKILSDKQGSLSEK